MKDEKKLSTPQKIIAALFALVLIGAACLMAWRVVQKPAYEARERMQCDLLAVSAAQALAQISETEPEIWAQFSAPVTLILDHRQMPDNWNLSVTAQALPNRMAFLIVASSGWNSRSPQRSELHVDLRDDGGLVYSGTKEEVVLTTADSTDTGKTVSFILLDGREPRVPLRMRVVETRMRDEEKPYLLLRAAD